eukprot:403366027
MKKSDSHDTFNAACSTEVSPEQENYISHNNCSNSIYQSIGYSSQDKLHYNQNKYESKSSKLLKNLPIKGNFVVNYRNYCLAKDQRKNIMKKNITNVLVICTGGTFCMVKTPRGYMVQKGLGERLKNYHGFYDKEFAAQLELDQDQLITPETPYKKRIIFKMLEYEELIDSSNITISNWVQLAQTIESNYKDYDGFVILQGTDTLAYTASALSFMLENLNKSVVVTGSQIPLSELKNDAIDNLLGSLIVAGHFQISEVMVFFANKLLRGNRSQKESTSDMTAFSSPNFPCLGTFGVDFEMNWDQTHRYMYEGKMTAFTNMSNNIAMINISPLFNTKIIECILESSQAVIIQTYGMGNIPNKNKDLLELIKKAIEKGVIIVILTQCHHGGVNDLYEAGRSLTEIGAVLGQDMTMESCYAKLSYLLGKDYSNQKIKKMLSKNLRGELTDLKHKEKVFSLKNSKLVEAIAKVLKSEDKDDYKMIANMIEPVLVNSIACSGDMEQIQKLKEQGVNFNSIDYRSRTALHTACMKGKQQVVEFLVNENMNLDQIDSTGCSPLYHAIRKGHEEIAHSLYPQRSFSSLSS